VFYKDYQNCKGFVLGSTFPNMILSGTPYVGSMIREWNAIDWFSGKLRGLNRSIPQRTEITSENGVIQTSSSSAISSLTNFSDYIFVDRLLAEI